MPSRVISLLALVLLGACGGGTSTSTPGSADGVPLPAPVDSAPAVAPNEVPVARAGEGRTAPEGSSVVLDGSASTDADGVIRSYAWRQTAGLPITLSGADSMAATFTAPEVAQETIFGFELTVVDDAGAAAADDVEIAISPTTFTVSGTIFVSPGSAMDGDVNDWNAARSDNDTGSQAQAIAGSVIVGGYVGVAGAGRTGAVEGDGDPSDYFRVELATGQAVTLLVADPVLGDADLYLWNESGDELIDASVETGAVEALMIGADATYLLEVTAYGGATNYTLLVGGAALPGVQSGLRLTDDFIPGDIILEWLTPVSQAVEAARVSHELEGFAMAEDRSGVAGPTLVRVAPADAARVGSATAGDEVRARTAAIGDGVIRHKYDTLMAIKHLRRTAPIRYAQPNFRIEPWFAPGDPLYPLQWHYPMIELPRAWELTRGDPSVTVAVVDTGVLTGHPDLAGRLLPGYDFVSTPENGADGDGLDPDPSDPGAPEGQRPSSFHGTHVAGTVAAAAGNGRGGTGVAPNVMIRPVRSLGVKGGSSYDIMQGVRYAAGLENDSGTVIAPADIINMSLGRTGRCWPAEQAVFDAVREAGVMVVGAAGNDGQDAADAFPANCNHVLAVGAVDRHGNRTSYSNFGVHVDVAAPGGIAADEDGDGYGDRVLSVGADDSSEMLVYNYAFKQGTSMASPHVAGVAALMKSVNPSLTPELVDELLAAGALTDGRGVIDAWRGVQAALNAEPLPDPVPVEIEAQPSSLSFGSLYNHARVQVRAAGRGGQELPAPAVNVPWLRVSIIGEEPGGAFRYDVTVDRQHVLPGTHSGVISIAAAGDTLEIPVIMQVEPHSGPAEAGPLYVLLLNALTGAVVREVMLPPRSGAYAFHFDGVDNGRYRLLAGSDRDNDLTVCDEGESCGRYSGAGPGVLEVSADTAGADFRVEHRATVPDEFGNAEAGTARPAAVTGKTVDIGG